MLIQKYRLSIGAIVGFGESYAVNKVIPMKSFSAVRSPNWIYKCRKRSLSKFLRLLCPDKN